MYVHSRADSMNAGILLRNAVRQKPRAVVTELGSWALTQIQRTDFENLPSAILI